MASEPPFVIGISGASGAPIAVRVVAALREAGAPVAVVVSEGGRAVLREEAGLEDGAVLGTGVVAYSDRDLAAPIASGSFPTRGMAIVPCSGTTIAKVALGFGDSLLTRAAQVHLKERRRLVVVPRETPLTSVFLRHLATLSDLGAVVLPATPAYYLHPKSIDDVTEYVAGKVLDHLGVAHHLYRGWKAGVD